MILSPCEKSVINEESQIKNNMPSSLRLSMRSRSERPHPHVGVAVGVFRIAGDMIFLRSCHDSAVS